MKVVVIGAGGHGEVVADILRAAAAGGEPIEFAGYVDDRCSEARARPVLGSVSALAILPHDAAIVAVGDNKARREFSERLELAGECLAVACHPSAVVAADVDQPGRHRR